MVSLVPADPLSDAQDSRCDLLGGCEDTWHGIRNPVGRVGTGDHHVLSFFPDFGSYV